MSFDFQKSKEIFENLLSMNWQKSQKGWYRVKKKDVTLSQYDSMIMLNEHCGYSFASGYSQIWQADVITVNDDRKIDDIWPSNNTAFTQALEQIHLGRQTIEQVAEGLTLNAFLQSLYKSQNVSKKWGNWKISFGLHEISHRKESSFNDEIQFFRTMHEILLHNNCAQSEYAVFSDLSTDSTNYKLKIRSDSMNDMKGILNDEFIRDASCMLKVCASGNKNNIKNESTKIISKYHWI